MSEPQIFDSVDEAQRDLLDRHSEKCGFMYGPEFCQLTKAQIAELYAGRVLAFVVNNEYVAVVKLIDPDDHRPVDRQWHR